MESITFVGQSAEYFCKYFKSIVVFNHSVQPKPIKLNLFETNGNIYSQTIELNKMYSIKDFLKFSFTSEGTCNLTIELL
jgi:hypothetical protein